METPQQQAEAYQRVMNRNVQEMLSAKDMQIIALKSQLEMLVPQIEALRRQVAEAKQEPSKPQPVDLCPQKPNGKAKEAM
jgi:polyhydroxyalkanoate synthesis regulator phasin